MGFAPPLSPHTLCVHISCKGTSGEDYIQVDRENVLELFRWKGLLFKQKNPALLTKLKCFVNIILILPKISTERFVKFRVDKLVPLNERGGECAITADHVLEA